jgi:D-inositol-3-phosphate glycosyltransferase
MLMAPRRVAVVVPAVGSIGGVQTVADFLCETIRRSGRYVADRISLATSARDAASVRLASPASWLRGAALVDRCADDERYVHSGCVFSEFEFQRYRPRHRLTRHLAQYDIIQVVAGTPAWALVARDAGRPIALQVATLAMVERAAALHAERGARGAWRRAMTRITTRFDEAGLRCSHVVAVENRWMLELVRERHGAAKARLQPPGVDTDRFTPPPPSGATGPLLSVGRFADPRKNIGMLFRAYARVRRTLPAAPRLVIAGSDAPTARDWSIAHALGIAQYIDVRCGLSDAALVRTYQEAGMFVLPSKEEGLGMVILEAMASGLPVVATRCGGPDAIVEDGRSGFLVNVDDDEAMARAIERVLRDEDLRNRMGECARQRIVQRFSLESAGRVFIEQYDELLDRGRDAAAQPASPAVRGVR